MADPQQQEPLEAEAVQQQRPSAQDEVRTARQGGGDIAAYWCYLCNKEVVAEPELDGQSMVCVECRNGFIEALVTAQTVPDVRRAQRRRRRRSTAVVGAAGTAPGAGGRQTVPLSEALEHLYPQQLIHVLQLLGQAAGRSNNLPATSPGQIQEDQTSFNAQGTPGYDVSRDLQATPGQGSRIASAHPAEEARSEEPDNNNSDGRPALIEGGEESPPSTAVEALERLPQEGQLLFIRDRSPSHEDEEADEELAMSDTETEEGMRLEFDAWDSADDDDEEEWEEVDEDEDAPEAGGDEDGGAGEENEPDQQEGEAVDDQQGEERQPRVRELRLRSRNIENNLHQYLQELLQNLVGQNIEVRVELPNGPLYVGNPGDYVDARGFEQILQQMAENDNSRRGAPPASNSAVNNLPSIAIEQRHLDDGTAICAICKDVVALGEPAKQLPCLHLYHQDCILPWLSSRNSCPVCRYELPTDDPDYEEQKQSRNGTVLNTSTQSRSPQNEQVDEGREGNDNDGEQPQGAQDSQNGAGDVTEHIESIADVIEQGDLGDQAQSVTELFGLRGSETTTTHTFLCENEGGLRERGERECDELERGEIQGTGRGWFLLAAGPMLSMVGLVLVLCIGNHLIGGRMQHLARPLERQDPGFFQDPHIEQVAVASDGQGRRRWWMPFQR